MWDVTVIDDLAQPYFCVIAASTGVGAELAADMEDS